MKAAYGEEGDTDSITYMRLIHQNAQGRGEIRATYGAIFCKHLPIITQGVYEKVKMAQEAHEAIRQPRHT